MEMIEKRSGKLLFTIGAPRSGKSTYADEWVRYVKDPPCQWTYGSLGSGGPFPRAIVCADDIRLALHGERFNKDAEPMVWAIHTYLAKSLLLRGHDVLVDGTNSTPESILRILHIQPSATYKFFDTPVETCKERARASGHHDLVDCGVIDRVCGQIEELKQRGIDNVVEEIRLRVRNRWVAKP